jgi:L-fuconolactonase
MVTEARWHQWQPGDFHRYMDTAFDAFGDSRLMIGSDWPVCTLAGPYQPVMKIVIDYLQKFSPQVQAAILGDNCARFYRIEE